MTPNNEFRRWWARLTPAQRQREINKYEAWLEIWEFRQAIRKFMEKEKSR